MTATMNNRPIPEALGRGDVPIRSGEWDVDGCAPTRGLPVTSVEERFMRVPLGDDELSVAIRAHELIHAKVSPTSLQPYLDRGFASDSALRSVEEVRVNYLATQLGYDMSVLIDGSETATGERAVAMDDWHGAVMFAVGTAGTGANKKFLNGVRRHNKVWGDVLADISRRAVKQMKKADKAGILRSTVPSHSSGLLEGFLIVEQIAEWVDRLAGMKPTPPDEDKDEKGESSDADTPKDETPKDETPKKRGRPRKDDSPTTGERRRYGDVEEPSLTPWTREVPEWMPLKIGETPLPNFLNGALGKKRVASAHGKYPRRIHRLLTDPERRVFDKVVKGKGGIVVIDCSGSMRLTTEQVKSIMLASPGCTVLCYTVLDFRKDKDGQPVAPNAWVIAKDGKHCDSMPFSGRANGCDLPALEWAVKNRKRTSSPIVWVCDGQVTGMGDEGHVVLSNQCAEMVRRHNIVIVPDALRAVQYLNGIAKGERPMTKYPGEIAEAMKRLGS